MSPAATIHTVSSHAHPRPEPCDTTSSYLEVRTSGPATGGQRRATAGGKSHSLLPVWAPQLPELLSLTESHGHVGDGLGGCGEGQKVPEASAAAVLLRQAAGDPRSKGRGDSTEKGPGHTGGPQQAPGLTLCGALATPLLLQPQFTHLWHVWVGHLDYN